MEKQMMDEFDSDFERGQYLQNMLISHATGGTAEDRDYKAIRKRFVSDVDTKKLLPAFVRTNRDLTQFWQFIKHKFAHYDERRSFIYSEFTPLLDFLEGKTPAPADNAISEGLRSFDEEGVHSVWSKALERRASDPEGAITAARTLLETLCKNILDARRIEYDSKKIELHELYKLVSKELNLSPSQHTQEVFKQILGGCSGVVNGLGTLRNKLGDAHGQGKLPVRPAPRHAELAVNLSGSVALFLVATFQEQLEKIQPPN
jgi:uncharacterized protein YfkK (UPF0435 family)